MRMITMFFIIACIITACSNDDNPNVEMTNGVTLSVVGNAPWQRMTQRVSTFMY